MIPRAKSLCRGACPVGHGPCPKTWKAGSFCFVRCRFSGAASARLPRKVLMLRSLHGVSGIRIWSQRPLLQLLPLHGHPVYCLTSQAVRRTSVPPALRCLPLEWAGSLRAGSRNAWGRETRACESGVHAGLTRGGCVGWAAVPRALMLPVSCFKCSCIHWAGPTLEFL